MPPTKQLSGSKGLLTPHLDLPLILLRHKLLSSKTCVLPRLTVDEEELQKVENDQQGVEGIEVDVEGVAPLHVKVPARMLQKVLVADEPGAEKAGMFRRGWKLDKKRKKKKINQMAWSYHMKVDMRSPTPMQSTKTTHRSSLSVSKTPMSSTRPKPIVDTAGVRNTSMVRKMGLSV